LEEINYMLKSCCASYNAHSIGGFKLTMRFIYKEIDDVKEKNNPTLIILRKVNIYKLSLI